MTLTYYGDPDNSEDGELKGRLKLPIKTVDNILEEAGEEVPWLI